jgi:hypothetical protein
MRYPTAFLFARRIMLNPNGPGAIYRSNKANMKNTWGKPVPSVRTPDGDIVLVFNNYAAPLSVYLPCLHETAHYPPKTPTGQIEFFPPQATAAELYRMEALRGETHQNSLLALRDQCIRELFHKLSKNPAYPYTEDVLGEVSIRIGSSTDVVLRVMKRDEGLEFVPRPAPAVAAKLEKESPWFARDDERYSVVQRALMVIRTSDDPKEPMMIDALATTDSGGYPDLCPVTGLPFEWHDGVSPLAPKVSRRDRAKPYAAGNALLMSAFAKRLLEGKASRDAVEKFIDQQPRAVLPIAAWLKTHPTSDPAVLHLLRIIPFPRGANPNPTPAYHGEEINKLTSGWLNDV